MRAGTILMWVGAAIVLIGALLRWAPGAFSWFGNLPGDIRIEGERWQVFIPITSMVLISLILSGVLYLAGLLTRDR